jgi:hypothetical protein
MRATFTQQPRCCSIREKHTSLVAFEFENVSVLDFDEEALIRAGVKHKQIRVAASPFLAAQSPRDRLDTLAQTRKPDSPIARNVHGRLLRESSDFFGGPGR